MITVAPKILALSYYDGATQGFFDETGSDKIYYFKVVAWDKSQDKRLYVLGQVNKAIYLELLDMLVKAQPLPTSSIWVPHWIFADDTMKNRANEIVEIAKQSMSSPAFFALGDDLDNVIKILPSTTEGLAETIALAGENEPGNLEDWLIKFNIKAGRKGA